MTRRAARTKNRVKGCTEKQVTMQVLDAAKIYGLKLERRNVGLAFNAAGKAVRFGKPGEPDFHAVFNGRSIHVEIKHETFDPAKLRGAKAEHFARQVAVMRELNAAGAFAFWTRSGVDAAAVFRRLVTVPGLRVEIDREGRCWTTDDA